MPSSISPILSPPLHLTAKLWLSAITARISPPSSNTRTFSLCNFTPKKAETLAHSCLETSWQAAADAEIAQQNDFVIPSEARNLLYPFIPRQSLSLAHRIIPCLDTDGARVVKGVNFVGLRDAGDPAELAARYNSEGADELVVLDIAASRDRRPTFIETIRRVAAELSIPLTAGGGIRTLDDARSVILAGADKVTVNTAAVGRPELIFELSREFGAQAVVLAIDAKRVEDHWDVMVRGGRDSANRDALAWAQEGVKFGAGEILLTSVDRDGTQLGFDIPLTAAISRAVSVPVIASGGAKLPEHFAQIFSEGTADAALAASIFHDNVQSIRELKQFLSFQKIEVRLPC
jgi:imidazole glycerol-phosphate synthase subunit HisF